jgi:lipopolysaccharide/colanic/teichoic acid biosynthesis glycosyltransferase
MAKRALDIICSVLALGLLGPLMVYLAVRIRLDSPGNPIFRQRRMGWRGRPFVMFKYRTMRKDVDPFGLSPHSGEDPRLTRIGRWLRETSLDELPQLWNVLNGTMSLVGPRPLYERQAERWTDRQRRRLEVKPGLTGYAQVYGRASLTHEQKIEMDLTYVEQASLVMDLKLIALTVRQAFSGRDSVYEQRYSDQSEYERHDDGKAALTGSDPWPDAKT